MANETRDGDESEAVELHAAAAAIACGDVTYLTPEELEQWEETGVWPLRLDDRKRPSLDDARKRCDASKGFLASLTPEQRELALNAPEFAESFGLRPMTQEEFASTSDGFPSVKLSSNDAEVLASAYARMRHGLETATSEEVDRYFVADEAKP